MLGTGAEGEPRTSLLPRVLYEIGSQAPSLSKDFRHLVITKTGYLEVMDGFSLWNKKRLFQER